MMRVLAIILPTFRILCNVTSNTVQIVFITNDMLIIIALPDCRTRSIANLVDATRRNGFEIADYRA